MDIILRDFSVWMSLKIEGSTVSVGLEALVLDVGVVEDATELKEEEIENTVDEDAAELRGTMLDVALWLVDKGA